MTETRATSWRIDRPRTRDAELAHRYYRIEAEWRRWNAGCCPGCGAPCMRVGFGDPDAICYACAGAISVSRDRFRQANIRAHNAAWKRHDREAELAANVAGSREWFAASLPRHPSWPKEKS